MSTTDTPTRALPTLFEFFSPGGILARSSLPYEYRSGQFEMAKAVERALEERRHLIVEAGTGTGKTLAYLLPALRTGQRVIISTGTKALQDQLYFRDIPFLETLLGPLRVCYMKGRANYLCRHKLTALRTQPILSGLEEIDQYRQIAEWEQTTETGDRAELSGMPESSALWQKLDARTEACLGSTCPDYRRCFITEMRRKALESDIIIVNHHLFFADLSVKQQAGGAPDAGILPEAAAVVFDEAHELEDVASNYFGLSVSNIRFEELARDTDALLRGKDGATGIPALTQQLRERARMFFAGLPMTGDGRQPFIAREEFLETSGDLYMAVRATLKRLEAEMEGLKGVDEAPGLKKRVARLRSELEFLLESNAHNMVYWMERRLFGGGTDKSGGRSAGIRSQSRSTFLQATPIDVSDLLSEQVFETIPTVVLTSATLTVKGGFEHMRKRLGLREARELVVPSHFRYEKQALLYLPLEMPDPRDADFSEAAARCIRQVLQITQGRAFCLFTSYSQMRDLYERLMPVLDFPILLHGSAPRKALLEEFRSTPNAVLFGTSSFWQGVDVQGEALSCVIIDRLPFAVPSDPVVSARMKAIEEDGGKPFFDYQVPAAVLTLKQGFGRLIRSLEDRGVLVLLDPRIRRQRYGQTFLASLPPYRVTTAITDVESFFEKDVS
ncbi:MAG: helicase C-terminal domain-containing protein [Terracidiphilus sp.]|nr:helicase C-terminal domain-containing protein [Terracidiphilus sp.]MDR3776222.1 helicase C-terminal domain-containing protein [Terracidiphilus sp.]